MTRHTWALRLATALVSLCAAALLPACGGGGGGGGDEATALRGEWQLALSRDAYAPVLHTMPADEVPTQAEVSDMTPEQFVRRFGAVTFPDSTITVNGGEVTVTSNYPPHGSILITGVKFAGYRGCGMCGTGSKIVIDFMLGTRPPGTTFLDEMFVQATYTRVN
ncbi:MAG TPA: hypothetical protein VNB23_12900 [Ramlibacter sp.]|nr:hypothetical protein [Ramlibacter sp.]